MLTTISRMVTGWARVAAGCDSDVDPTTRNVILQLPVGEILEGEAALALPQAPC